MNKTELLQIRLQRQQISEAKFGGVKELVHWMGAMQAQDYVMAKWAIGIRIPGSTDNIVESALNEGNIIRTHLMRPTWHLVSADDIYWMLELTAPQIKTSLKSRHKQLEITESVVTKSKNIFLNALSKNGHQTRDLLIKELEKSGINTKENRASHLFLMAELDGLICSGISSAKKQTFALLAERVPGKRLLKRDEALAELAMRYFSSHGPATLYDFIWWSGLPARDARKALDILNSQLTSTQIDTQIYWFDPNHAALKSASEQVHLLPAYDEFIISYKDRSACLMQEYVKKTISSNGMFWPVIIVDGKVIGLWKRTIKKDTVIFGIDLFQSFSEKIKSLIEKRVGEFGAFINKYPQIIYLNN